MQRRSLLAGFGAVLAAPALHAQTLQRASLRLKWLPQAQFAGFYLAKARGYYAAEGIDLTINPGGPNLLTENLVATNADTFGLSGGTDSVFAAREKALPVVCIGVSHQVTPFFFVSRADGPIRTLQDMRGKNLTAWFTGAHFVLRGMLAQAGLKPEDYNLQPQQVSVTFNQWQNKRFAPTPLVFTQQPVVSGGNVSFKLQGLAGKQYRYQLYQVAAAGQWTPVGTPVTVTAGRQGVVSPSTGPLAKPAPGKYVLVVWAADTVANGGPAVPFGGQYSASKQFTVQAPTTRLAAAQRLTPLSVTRPLASRA